MKPTITPDVPVADIAAAHPATVAVFQRHKLAFCCGGDAPLGEACREQGLDAAAILAELEAATAGRSPEPDWEAASLTDLVRHIQAHYHEPLRAELPRLAELLARVVERHGQSYPERLLPLRDHFQRLAAEMLHHMRKEDAVLFPAVVTLEAAANDGDAGEWGWIEQPMRFMEAEHAAADADLAAMRDATRDYALPEGACPTFRGLYHGLEQLERDLGVHVHLENDILFPRAARLVHQLES